MGLGGLRRRVPSMRIHVDVFNRVVDQEILGLPPGPGHQFVFSFDLALKKYNRRKQHGQHVLRICHRSPNNGGE